MFCRNRSRQGGHGLEAISLHKQDEGLQKQWTSTLVVPEESDDGSFDVHKVASRCGLTLDKLSDGLADLDRMMGTSQFRIKESQDGGNELSRYAGDAVVEKTMRQTRTGGLKKYATDVHPGLLKGEKLFYYCACSHLDSAYRYRLFRHGEDPTGDDYTDIS